MSGSGRRRTSMTAKAASIPTPENRYAPVRGGSPTMAATALPGPDRFGPRTDPTVVAHTTRERSLPRWAGSERSVAAYRLWLLAAVVAPRNIAPTRSTGKIRRTPARMDSAVPRMPRAYPRDSPIRRPWSSMTRASSRVTSAVPKTAAVCARPASDSTPDTSLASMAFTEIAAPTPRPPSTWVDTRVARVRRCTSTRAVGMVITGRVCQAEPTHGSRVHR